MTKGDKELGFDINEFCKNLRNAKQPPYQCPVADCLRKYRTIVGLQYHLKRFDHSNPSATPHHGRHYKRKGRQSKAPAKTQELLQPIVREALTYAEAQKMVEFEVDGRVIRVGMVDPIPVMSKVDYEARYGLSDAKEGKPIPRLDPMKPDEQKIKLPEPSFTILDNYNISDAPPRPTNAYIRFIERSADELDGEVEYDLDEEDCAWLAIMNELRGESGLPAVSVDTFELLMDRLEKESYFQMANSKNTECGSSDDDAVCCICMDGECQNTNVILFCDMCNLAVHQDCYGVPYIPEGQWLCRRCLQSPSRAVDCLLCPNNGGAFKQTDRGNWAHVVCALWIPEVRFANTVFLEPIDSIETIPPARWKLTCYICKQRGVGACIQCHKTNCYAAFHVTCAQQAGLYMKMDTVRDTISTPGAGEQAPIMVQKTAFCDTHTPADAENRPRLPTAEIPSPGKSDNKLKMKKARKMLAKKRSAVPVISIPTIPPDRVQEIGSLVSLPKKSHFIQRLIAYWTLKRQFRNGVPLLRRLQTTHLARRDDGKLVTELGEFYRQIKYLQCLRQDLEKARLLCELVRKREKKKNELTRAKESCLMVELSPLQYFLTRIWEQISARDSNAIFMEPVDVSEVPDYSEVVKHPMDLSTMKSKIDEMKYLSIAEFEVDFNLMINNCLAYNAKDTIFYRAGLRMREQGGVIIRSAVKDAKEMGMEMITGSKKPQPHPSEEQTAGDVDTELAALQKSAATMSLDDQMKKLIDLADMAQSIKDPNIKSKKCRLIKAEMTKLKRKISKAASKHVEKEKTPEKVEVSVVETPKRKTPRKGSTGGATSGGDSSSSEDRPLKPAPKTAAPAAAEKSRRKRRRSPEAIVEPKRPAGNPEVVAAEKEETRGEATPTKVPQSNEAATASPSGVNRRSTVLFRKAQAVATAQKKSVTPPKEIPVSPTPPKRRVGRPRRNPEASTSTAKQDEKGDKEKDEDLAVPCSDSFRFYRSGGDIPQETDEESQSESSCSSCSSGSGSTCSSSSDGEGSGSSSESEETGRTGNSKPEPALEPLDLVWAKCRGYPWYPALIINPKMPRDYVHNGVPIPAPPADVLALANSYAEPVYLVLFFDTKRTWQWLPRDKLEVLGPQELDVAKQTESRKPADRKAVKRAYQEALAFRAQVDKVTASTSTAKTP